MANGTGNYSGWLVAGSALLILVTGFQVGTSTASPRESLRSEHADPAAAGTPDDMMVVVSKDGKTFHRPECRYIHDRAQEETITAGQAIQAGYVPCIRCMRQYAR